MFGHFASKFVVVASLLPILAGCADVVPTFDVPYQNIPDPQSGTKSVPKVTSIVERIRCELREIAGNNAPLINKVLALDEDMQVAVELSLTVTDDGALAPTYSIMRGIFSFSGGGTFDQSREQNFTQYLTFSLSSFLKEPNEPSCDKPADTNLSGRLGISEIFETAVRSSGPFVDWSKTGGTGAFGGSVTFTVNKELTATGPTWKLTHFAGPGAFLTASDKNVDTLTIGFARGPKANKAASINSALGVISSVKESQIAGSLKLIANQK